jgi:hypothetical protein
MVRVDLPYPHALLWPNGRTRNPHARPAQVNKHRRWAHDATMADPAWRTFAAGETPVPVRIIVSRKAAGVYPDRDNASAAAKSYLDGIAQRLGVNDRLFDTPDVEFVPEITGRFVIEIGS